MKLSLTITKVITLGYLSQLGSAWYLQVHNQVGFIADMMLNDNARYMVSQILEPEYKGSMGLAAAWADSVSKTTHPYSYGWHWISAKDNPPDQCGLYYNRDCQPGGCVVQQIANQTTILEGCIKKLKDGDSSHKQDVNCANALKWVIHFVMDVAEPMHTSNLAYGGNLFKVIFNGTTTNMHQTWDRHILFSQTNNPDGFSGKEVSPYFLSLLERIQTDSFRQPRALWAICDWEYERGTYCPELWAQNSNAIVCDYCYGKYENGTDLYDSGYAAGALPIVEEQLAKAAWRLSGWINTISNRLLSSTGHDQEQAGGYFKPGGIKQMPMMQEDL